MKQGFVLNYARCRNCCFRVQLIEDRGVFNTISGSKIFDPSISEPKNLKEDIFAEVIVLHDTMPGKRIICAERSLIVSYDHCVYE